MKHSWSNESSPSGILHIFSLTKLLPLSMLKKVKWLNLNKKNLKPVLQLDIKKKKKYKKKKKRGNYLLTYSLNDCSKCFMCALDLPNF